MNVSTLFSEAGFALESIRTSLKVTEYTDGQISQNAVHECMENIQFVANVLNKLESRR